MPRLFINALFTIADAAPPLSQQYCVTAVFAVTVTPPAQLFTAHCYDASLTSLMITTTLRHCHLRAADAAAMSLPMRYLPRHARHEYVITSATSQYRWYAITP